MSRDDELIAGYLDDSLTEEQAREFRESLSAEPEKVKKLTIAMARDEQLRAVVASTESLSAAERKHVTQSKQREAMSWTRAKVVVAASLVALIAWFGMQARDSGSFLTLTETDGLVSLRSDDRAAVSRLSPGETISSGTLFVEGGGVQSRLAYADGSTLWLSGGTELSLIEGEGKSLLLQSGTLRADILPQPAGRPLTVRTATAEATVIGTSFALTAVEHETRLVVNEGAVKLQRLSDEQVLRVNANEQVRIGHSGDKPVQAVRSPTVPASWAASRNTDADTINGTLVGTWNDAGILTATPEGVVVKETGLHEIHYRAGMRKCYPGVVTLDEGSVVRVRYRVKRPINLGIFISTHLPSWAFAGNFRAYIETSKIPADKDGWRTATVPIPSLIPMQEMSFQPGSVVSTLFATTFADDVGLELAELEVSFSVSGADGYRKTDGPRQ